MINKNLSLKNLLSKKTVLISAVAAVVAVTICAVFIFRGCNKNETAASDNAAKTGVTVASDEKKGNTAAGNKDSGNEVAESDSEKLENEGGTASVQTGDGADTGITAGTSGDNSQSGSQNNAQGGNQGTMQNGTPGTSDTGSQGGNQNTDNSGSQNNDQGGNQNTDNSGSQNSNQSGNQDAGQGGNQNTDNSGSQNGDQSGNQDAGQGGNEDAPQDELPDFPYECYVLTERLLHNIYGEPLYYIMGYYVPVNEYGSDKDSAMTSRLYERSEELYGKVLNNVGIYKVNEQGTPTGFTEYKTGTYYFVGNDHAASGFEYKGY